MSLNLPIWRDSARLGVLTEEAVRGLEANPPRLAHYAQPVVAPIVSRPMCPPLSHTTLGNDPRWQAMTVQRPRVRALNAASAKRLGQRLWVAKADRQRPGPQRRVARHCSLDQPLASTHLTSGDPLMSSRTALALALVGALAAPAVLAYCNPNIRRSAPDARDAVNAAQGTVLDKQTGLMWKRCVEGRSGADCGVGSVTSLRWGGALSQAAASAFAGYKDWRLPNSKELESLVEVACARPALNANVFPNDPGAWVWASSPIANNYSYYAWYVGFDYGHSGYGNRSYTGAVRLVRGGQ
jgi:hypothetical protein